MGCEEGVRSRGRRVLNVMLSSLIFFLGLMGSYRRILSRSGVLGVGCVRGRLEIWFVMLVL